MSQFQTREFDVAFATPAFLGNAEQQGQWRVPPFKAALRHWWRIAMAPETGYSHKQLREREGRLFGHAWLESDQDKNGKKVNGRKSSVQLRLSQWDDGKLQPSQWPPARDFGQVGRISSDLYLGYGPIDQHTKRPQHASVSDTQGARFRLRFPGAHTKELDQALCLMAWFATLGSRSRNGWGSLQMNSQELAPLTLPAIEPFMRELDDCLQLDWPHAIGSDRGRPLVWHSDPVQTWTKAMGKLAHLKVAMRTEAKSHRSPGSVAGIHLLSYPAGKGWELPRLDKEARSATQIRFKVVKEAANRYRCLVVHTPTAFPLFDKLDRRDQDWIKQSQLDVYRAIHRVIDGHASFQRIDQE